MHDRNTIEHDVAAIRRIEAVPRILRAVTEITGMRFAAVARVTETRWTACAVRDELGFGLEPGGELELETTICNEIRQHQQAVVFGHAREHPIYAQHHTPKLYGLESYISVPIFRAGGEFFGTLCAIDSRPADVEAPGVLPSLELFAELIGLQLELVEDLDTARRGLTDSRVREALLTRTEEEIRDLLQPIVTNLYLLQTSSTLGEADRALLQDMHASCRAVTRLLRERLDRVLEAVAAPTA
ncbi:MAG TPA: GAF domain-containing protein [Lysobacter sp.]|nr:GAF domain-containing protein [Lysobacter sp.]